VDWILVATKAYDSEAATQWFPNATGPRTRLAVIQNGVEHIARFEKRATASSCGSAANTAFRGP